MNVYKAEIEITAEATVEADTQEEAEALFEKARKNLHHTFALSDGIACNGFFMLTTKVKEERERP